MRVTCLSTFDFDSIWFILLIQFNFKRAFEHVNVDVDVNHATIAPISTIVRQKCLFICLFVCWHISVIQNVEREWVRGWYTAWASPTSSRSTRMNCAIIRLDQSARRSVSVKQFVQPCGTRHSGVRLENETQKTLECVGKNYIWQTSWVKDD